MRGRIHAGNIYVNRNQIGAVVGVQPFGGEGLSGTGRRPAVRTIFSVSRSNAPTRSTRRPQAETPRCCPASRTGFSFGMGRFSLRHRFMADQRAHIVVFGNEKGGSGKTTAAMHVAVALARRASASAAIDLDTRQRSFARHLENRGIWRDKAYRLDSRCPRYCRFRVRYKKSLDEAAEEEGKQADHVARREAETKFDFIVIDTPGADTQLSRQASRIGQYARHADERQLRRFRSAGAHRSRDLRGQVAQPLQRFRLGVPQEAVAGTQAGARLGGDAQPHLGDRGPQQDAVCQRRSKRWRSASASAWRRVSANA